MSCKPEDYQSPRQPHTPNQPIQQSIEDDPFATPRGPPSIAPSSAVSTSDWGRRQLPDHVSSAVSSTHRDFSLTPVRPTDYKTNELHDRFIQIRGCIFNSFHLNKPFHGEGKSDDLVARPPYIDGNRAMNPNALRTVVFPDAPDFPWSLGNGWPSVPEFLCTLYNAHGVISRQEMLTDDMFCCLLKWQSLAYKERRDQFNKEEPVFVCPRVIDTRKDFQDNEVDTPWTHLMRATPGSRFIIIPLYDSNTKHFSVGYYDHFYRFLQVLDTFFYTDNLGDRVVKRALKYLTNGEMKEPAFKRTRTGKQAAAWECGLMAANNIRFILLERMISFKNNYGFTNWEESLLCKTDQRQSDSPQTMVIDNFLIALSSLFSRNTILRMPGIPMISYLEWRDLSPDLQEMPNQAFLPSQVRQDWLKNGNLSTPAPHVAHIIPQTQEWAWVKHQNVYREMSLASEGVLQMFPNPPSRQSSAQPQVGPSQLPSVRGSRQSSEQPNLFARNQSPFNLGSLSIQDRNSYPVPSVRSSTSGGTIPPSLSDVPMRDAPIQEQPRCITTIDQSTGPQLLPLINKGLDIWVTELKNDRAEMMGPSKTVKQKNKEREERMKKRGEKRG